MMDAVGVVWLYEPRREDTRHGWYKPDFYVPAAGVFVEVKGPAPTKVEVEKAADVEAATGCPVIFAYGRPELVRGQVKGAELAYFFKGKRAVISLEEIRELVFQSIDLRTHSEFLAALASQQQYHLRDISNILLGWLTVLLDRSQQEDIFEKNNKPLNDLKASRHLQHSRAEWLLGCFAERVLRLAGAVNGTVRTYQTNVDPALSAPPPPVPTPEIIGTESSSFSDSRSSV